MIPWTTARRQTHRTTAPDGSPEGRRTSGAARRTALAGVWPARSRARPDASLRGLTQLRAEAASARQDELSEQAVSLAIGPGGEDELVGPGGVPVAETQAPQAVDDGRPAVDPAQLAQVRAGDRVVGVDVAIAEVTDEQRSAEPAEAGRGQSEPPWRVQRAPGGQPAQERAVVGEDVHESVTRAGHVIFAVGVWLRIGHVELAREFRDVERRVTEREQRVHEPAAGQYDRIEAAVVDLYP